MGGFLGLGGSSAKTDRGAQLGARQGLWNVFNYSLPAGEAGQAAGQSTLSSAASTLGAPKDYFKSLMTAGRTQTAANSAPAINSAVDQSDATRRAEASHGTSRGGGTASANRESGTSTAKSVDDIINTNLMGGRAEGAKGLTEVAGKEASIGGFQLSNAMNLLGLGEKSATSILDNATSSRQAQQQQDSQTSAALGKAAASILLAFL